MHMFLAIGGEKVAEQNSDDSEEVEVLLMSIYEVKQLVKYNKIMQSLHMNCIMYALARLEDWSLKLPLPINSVNIVVFIAY